MAPLAEVTAKFAAEALVSDSAGPIQVLDLGAGHGLYGLAIAEQNSSAQIFALDAPEVLEIALDNARQAGVAGRYHPIPGDAFKTDFGGPYDLVLAANVAHHFDEAANVKLFRKARAALKSSPDVSRSLNGFRLPATHSRSPYLPPVHAALSTR